MMYNLRVKITRYFTDESGATAIEYALLSDLIGLSLIGVTKAFGIAMGSVFDTVNDGLDGVEVS